LRTIAEKLGVANLLEGSIRKDGSQLRITAQLINGKSGTHMWSQTYARESKEIFAVQEEIAKDVAQALSIKLDVGDTSRAMGGTTNLEAYYKYLQARTLGYQGGTGQFDQASQLYREAVALDPTFSRAWVGLMGALRGTLVWAPESTAAATKEMDDIRVHLETIAPDAWWTQAERSSYLLRQHKWYEAEASINAALATAPASGLDVVKAAEAAYLAASGRIKDLVSHLERWRKMDPLSLTVSGELQAALSSAGRPEDSQVEYERSKTLVGDHGQWEHHALLRLMSSKDADPAVIKVQFRQFVDHEPVPMALDHVLVDILDDKAAARAAIRRAFEDPANNDGTRMAIVMYYADRFGDRDLALAALRKEVFELRYSLINQFTIWYPFMSGVRAAPGFKEIVRDLGLVDYWRVSGNWGDFCKPVGKDDFECH
jgi:tetratricopeptide (TPR) repeat protein